jgi:quercetin dioxygenase-like cupin family protein
MQALKWEGLREEIQIGLDQAARGEVAPLDVQATLAKVRGRRKGLRGEANMTRILLAVIVGMALGAGGLSLASHDGPGPGKVTTLSERDVVETLDGKEARVTMVEVAYEPGGAGQPHRHSGPVFGYVLEGEFEIGLDDQPAKTLKAGETFYEPGGILHRVSRNPSTTARTRVLAVILHPRDAKQITLPAAPAKEE